VRIGGGCGQRGARTGGGYDRAPLFLLELSLHGLGLAGPGVPWPWQATGGGRGWTPPALVILGHSDLEWMEPGVCCMRVTDAEVSWLALSSSSSSTMLCRRRHGGRLGGLCRCLPVALRLGFEL
jgi:hypothetical protein